jgi:hypothetical protein
LRALALLRLIANQTRRSRFAAPARVGVIAPRAIHVYLTNPSGVPAYRTCHGEIHLQNYSKDDTLPV